MIQFGFPFSIEDLLASAIEVFKAHGDARSIAVLLEGDCHTVYLEEDFGIDYWRILIAIPAHFFCAMTEQDRESTADAIKNVMAPFFAVTRKDGLGSVVIIPQVSEARDGWREEAIRFIKGEGVTNQGRVRSDNIASKQG